MLFLVGGRRFTRAELLVGNLGYALATFLALGMHRGFASACAPFRAAALAAAAGR